MTCDHECNRTPWNEHRRLANCFCLKIVILIAFLASLTSTHASIPLVITEGIIIQLKFVPPYKMLKNDDPFHTLSFFENSVQLFLSNMFRGMGGSSKFKQLQIFRVDVQNQVLGTRKNSLIAGDRSDLTEDDMRPIHVNVTLTGQYSPTQENPTIKNEEYIEIVLSLFNDKGRELAERLQDLTDVTYFRNVKEVRAMPASVLHSISEPSISLREADMDEPEQESEVHFYKEATAISAISVGAVGLILLAIGVGKVVSLRRSYKLVDTMESPASFPGRKGHDATSEWPHQSFNLHETRPSFHPYGPRPAHVAYEYSSMNGLRENLALTRTDRSNIPRGQDDNSTIKTDGTSASGIGKQSERLSGRPGRPGTGASNEMRSKDSHIPKQQSSKNDGRNLSSDQSSFGTEQSRQRSYSSSRPKTWEKRNAKKQCVSEPSEKDDFTEGAWSGLTDIILSGGKAEHNEERSGVGADSLSSAKSRPSKSRDISLSEDDCTRASSVRSRSSAKSQFKNLTADSYDGITRECFAPPGKLGVAIDTGPGGVGPIVYKLKPGSPLEGILKPGDRIVAIDDVDARFMSAANVTKMMVKKMDSRRKIAYMTLGV